MAERKMARLFQGAKIALGGVGDLGRPASDMTDDELAYLAARFMDANGEPNPAILGGKVYPLSIGRVFTDLFGYEAVDEKRLASVRSHLKHNGIRPWMLGTTGFNGWIVPDGWVWDSATDLKMPTVAPEEAVVEAEVLHAWYCRKGCGRQYEFRTEEERDHHEVMFHEEKEEAVEAAESTTVEAPGGVTVTKKGLPKLTKEQKQFLALVQKHPGKNLRDYVKQTHHPIQTRPLKKLGLIESKGNTAGTRIYPLTTIPADKFPERQSRHDRAPVRDDVLAFIKANPNNTAREIEAGTGRGRTVTLKALADLEAMRKIRSTGTKYARPYGGGDPLRYTVRSSGWKAATGKAPEAPKMAAGVTIVAEGAAVDKITAVFEEVRQLREENARLQAEVAEWHEVKRVLGYSA